jgi:uncharacterized protein (DUF1697 family)
MTKYVALLRGIAPMNPAMSNANLRAVCEDVGLQNVSTVISSGNVVFETDTTDRAGLEATLETAWPEKLGFESTTILRSQDELEALVELSPFGDLEHGPGSYLLVTFSKHPLKVDFETPFHPADRDYQVVAATTGEVFTVTDMTSGGTPDVMVWVEAKFGKLVSSRTWLTVGRILKKMG